MPREPAQRAEATPRGVGRSRVDYDTDNAMLVFMVTDQPEQAVEAVQC